MKSQVDSHPLHPLPVCLLLHPHKYFDDWNRTISVFERMIIDIDSLVFFCLCELLPVDDCQNTSRQGIKVVLSNGPFRNRNNIVFKLSIPEVKLVNHDGCAVGKNIYSQRFPKHFMRFERTTIHLSNCLTETRKMITEIQMVNPFRYITLLVLPLSCIITYITDIAIPSQEEVNPFLKIHDSLDLPTLR